MQKDINVVAFDADDTLWVNETMFRDCISLFCDLLSGYDDHEVLGKTLESTQTRNLEVFGYGAKSFTLSMIETAIEVSGGQVASGVISQIIAMGKEMNRHPVRLIDGIEEVLRRLSERFRLMLITKGDLIEQERKICKSGLKDYFSCIKVVSEKDETAYKSCLDLHGIKQDEFLMVGNSVKSDVLPVINIGAQAIHIPFHTTWCHEQVCCSKLVGKDFMTLDHASELLPVLLGDKVRR